VMANQTMQTFIKKIEQTVVSEVIGLGILRAKFFSSLSIVWCNAPRDFGSAVGNEGEF